MNRLIVMDLVASSVLLSLLAIVALGYGIRVLVAGPARHERVERDGGSALLPKAMMEVGHWAATPVATGLRRAGISANHVTLASFALSGASGVAVAWGHFGLAALIGAVASLGDLLDGIVARQSASESHTGEILDASVDRYSELFLFTGIACYFRANVLLLAVTLLALGGAFMTSYASARATSLRVEVPRGGMRRPERAVLMTVALGVVPLLQAIDGKAISSEMARLPVVVAVAAIAVVGNASAVSRLVRAGREADRLRIERRLITNATRAPASDTAFPAGANSAAHGSSAE